MEFDNLVLKRRSTREFTDKPVTREQIDYILSAAIKAPSARNMQSWHFYAVADPGVKAKFKSFCADWVSKAPVVFVICTDGGEMLSLAGKKGEKFIIQDTALAMENMLLAAANIGLGGCIIGSYDDDICRRELNIPQKYAPVALMSVGEPAKDVPPRERKPLEEAVTYI